MPEEKKPQEPPITAASFDIPKVNVEPLRLVLGDSLSASETSAFSAGREWELRSTKWDWWLRTILKIALFIVVIGMNVWWTHRVLQLVWESANEESKYHLANSVLIALVTTSLANFLALVAIVAKHLYPSDSSK